MVVTCGVRYKFIPDGFPRVAVECCPEHENKVEKEHAEDGRPGPVPHEFVDTPLRRKQANVLEKDSHLDQEAERIVNDFSGIRPLRSWSAGTS